MPAQQSARRELGVRLFAASLILVAIGLIGCAGGPDNFNQDLLGGGGAGVEGGASGSVATPMITTVTPAIAGPGETVTIQGSNFGIAQLSSSHVFFSLDGIVSDLDSGPVKTPSNWSPTSIKVTVPSIATTGPVMVVVEQHTFLEQDSNLFPFNLSSPIIKTVVPSSGINPGEFVTLNGANFGTQQFTTSRVFFSTTTSAAFQAFGVQHGGIDAGTVLQPTDWSNTKIRIPIPVGAHVTNAGGVGDVKIVLGLGARNQRDSSSAAITPTSLPFGGISEIVAGSSSNSVGGAMSLALDAHNVPNMAFFNNTSGATRVDFMQWQGTPTSGSFVEPTGGVADTLPGGDTASRAALALDTVTVTPNRPTVFVHDQTINRLRASTLNDAGTAFGLTTVASGGMQTNTSAPIAVVTNPKSGLARVFIKQLAGAGYVGCYRQLTSGASPTWSGEVTFEGEGAVPPVPPDFGLDLGYALSAAVVIPPQGSASQAIIGVAYRDPQPTANFNGRVMYQVSNADGAAGSYLVGALGIITLSTVAALVPNTEVGFIGLRTAVVFNGPSKNNVVVFATHNRKGTADTDLIACQPAAGKNPDDVRNWTAKLIVQTSLVTGPAAEISAAAGAFGRIIVCYQDKNKGFTVGSYNPTTRSFTIVATPVANVGSLPGSFISAGMTEAQKCVAAFQDQSNNTAAFLFTEP